jgi:hypothetical protein
MADINSLHPGYMDEWNRVREAGDRRSFDAWLRDHITSTGDRDPGAMEYLGMNPNGATTWADQAQSGLQAGADRAAAGGNTNQLQGSQQSGEFNSTGTQTQTGTQIGNTSQQMNQTGTTQGQTVTSGTQNQSGTSSTTSQMGDEMGFGALLKSQGSQIAATDATRSGFLSDLVQTGGKGFQDQVAMAANTALSGPGMQGTGRAAQGRVAGSAVGDVARNNMGQRLQASQQLSGPTGLQTASQAALPYNSQTQNQSFNNTTQSNSVADTNQTTQSSGTQTGQSFNLSDLVSNQAQTGTSKASGVQVATGQIPEGKSTSSGGCYVCTAYVELGLMHPAAVRRGALYKLANLPKYGRSLFGYTVYGPALARLVLRSTLFALIFYPVARAVLYEECRRATGVRLRRKMFASIVHDAFHYGSYWVGRIAKRCGYKAVQAPGVGVMDALKKHNLLFTFDLDFNN